MEKPETTIWKLYKRLLMLASKTYHCDQYEASEAAGHGIVIALEREIFDFAFIAVATKNFILTRIRDKRRRNETYELATYDSVNEILHLPFSAPTQELSLVARECVQAIEELGTETRDVLRRAATESTAAEIANELGIQKKEVYWRLHYGRKLLRERDGYGIGRKRGHHKYIGIRKDHNKWCASIRKDDHYYHIGYFSTASDAARAYDAKAKILFGTNAKFNFLGNSGGTLTEQVSPHPTPPSHELNRTTET